MQHSSPRCLLERPKIVSTNPALPGDIVFRVSPAGGIDVDRAVERAALAARGYAAPPAAARGQALHSAADALEADAAPLAGLICREVGKPITEARGEMARAVAILRFYAQVCLDPDGESYPLRRRPLAARHPPRAARRGRADHALELPAGDPGLEARAGACLRQRLRAEAVAAALRPAPSELRELFAGAAARGRARAGARRGRHRRGAGRPRGAWRRSSFTGSERGRPVGRRRSWPERGAAAQCEMGGQNAAIVLADADVEAAAGDDRVGGDGLRRPEVHRHQPRDLRGAASTTSMREALVAAVARPGGRATRPTRPARSGR